MKIAKSWYVVLACLILLLSSALAGSGKPVKPKAKLKDKSSASVGRARNVSQSRAQPQPKQQPQAGRYAIARPAAAVVGVNSQRARYSVALIREGARSEKTPRTLQALKRDRANSLPEDYPRPMGSGNLHPSVGTRAGLMDIRPGDPESLQRLPAGTRARMMYTRPSRPRTLEVQEYAKAFEGGKPEPRVLQHDLMVYCYVSGDKPGQKWFSTEKYSTMEEAAQGLALQSKPKNRVAITIRAGTMIYEGTAARTPGKTGGGHQIFVAAEDRMGKDKIPKIVERNPPEVFQLQ